MSNIEPTDVMVDASKAFAQASEPDLPQIDPPGSGQVTLMWGLAGADESERLLQAEVRELNGADEEAMARLNERSPSYFIDLVDVVLRRAVVLVGTETITPQNAAKVLGQLTVFDRDLLFKQIITATFGTEREYEDVRCPNCNGLNDIFVDVEGLIEVTKLEGPPTFTFNLKNGDEVEGHYPIGLDQKFVYDTKEDLSQAELNTRMIGRCIDSVNGRPVMEQEAQRFARQMGMADRRKIVDLLANGPSVKFKEVEVPCTECGEPIPFAFGWADLLWV